jgi:NAD+ diphosphatase
MDSAVFENTDAPNRGSGAIFKFCPSCASPRLLSVRGRMWVCPQCGFEYFHNVATGAGVVIESNGSVVLVRRAKEPRKDFFAFPGGFVDPGESAEDAVRRECREELGWAPASLKFLATFPNSYIYAGIPYSTCDLYFCACADGLEASRFMPDAAEVSEIALFPVETIPWDEIAFESASKALRKYCAERPAFGGTYGKEN